MEIEPRDRPARRVTEAEQEAAAAGLRAAVGDGRLTLEEFSDRVAAVWAAESTAELERAAGGVQPHPVVGSNHPVSTVVAVLGDQRRTGRWRLPARLRTVSMFGDVHLDLRSVVYSEDQVEISSFAMMGDIDIEVPDGVEVEVTGFDVFGDREVRLAPVPRIPGTPLIRVKARAIFCDVTVRSTSAGKPVPGWRRWLLGEQSPPVDGSALPPPCKADESHEHRRADHS